MLHDVKDNFMTSNFVITMSSLLNTLDFFACLKRL